LNLQDIALIAPSVMGWIYIILILILIWIIVSIPVYIAAKIVTGGKATFGQAMLATLLGPIVYVLVLSLTSIFLGFLVGPYVLLLALILAFIAWLGVYKSSFNTGWLQALGIALLAIVILFILNLILAIIFGAIVPILFPIIF